MEVIPAIDLRDGNCVRLYQGDYARETIYSRDPVEAALRWVEQGASRLHIVDLDGARAGVPVNTGVVSRIASAVPVPVQLGGGIRTVESARDAVSAGVDRVILGTAAVEDPDLVAATCDALGTEGVVVGVDARDGYVAIKGWTEHSRVPAADLMSEMRDLGVARFLYTDISRDGTLTGPNFDALAVLISDPDVRILAAGGISSIEHLLRLESMGVEGAIVGTAVYTGDIDLSAAVEALSHGANTSS